MATAATTLRDDPATTVERFVDAFNKVDVEGMAACFTVPSFILDGMAPHVWSGASAPADWCRDALAEADHLGISDFHVTLDPPLHNTVTGEAAYFVAPATMTFKARGQTVTQTGAILTLAFRRVDGRWLISAWTWTKGSGGGVDDVVRPT
jgi:ketosteroid isomerase-like protein